MARLEARQEITRLMTADHCILLSSRSRGEAASDDSVEAASINMQPVTRAPRTMAGEE